MFSDYVLRVEPSVLFFFNDTATTEIYTLSLHDALPISRINISLAQTELEISKERVRLANEAGGAGVDLLDRSEEHTSELQSPVPISYAVFCLKKKKTR